MKKEIKQIGKDSRWSFSGHMLFDFGWDSCEIDGTTLEDWEEQLEKYRTDLYDKKTIKVVWLNEVDRETGDYLQQIEV